MIPKETVFVPRYDVMITVDYSRIGYGVRLCDIEMISAYKNGVKCGVSWWASINEKDLLEDVCKELNAIVFDRFGDI
jgi:hypothetical protein